MIDLSHTEFKPNFQMPLQDHKYQSQPKESKILATTGFIYEGLFKGNKATINNK